MFQILFSSCAIILLGLSVVDSFSAGNEDHGEPMNTDLTHSDRVKNVVKRQSEEPGDFDESDGPPRPPPGPRRGSNTTESDGPKGGGGRRPESGSRKNSSEECHKVGRRGNRRGKGARRGGGGGAPGMGMGPPDEPSGQESRLYGRTMDMSRDSYELRGQKKAREGRRGQMCSGSNQSQGGGRNHTRRGDGERRNGGSNNRGPPPPPIDDNN